MVNFAKILEALFNNIEYIIFVVLAMAITFISQDYYPEDKLAPMLAAAIVVLIASLYYDRIKYGWADN